MNEWQLFYTYIYIYITISRDNQEGGERGRDFLARYGNGNGNGNGNGGSCWLINGCLLIICVFKSMIQSTCCLNLLNLYIRIIYPTQTRSATYLT